MLCLSLQKRICFAPARQSGPVCRKNFTAPRRHFADIQHCPPHTAARKTLSTFGKTILTLEKTVSTFVFSKVLTVFSGESHAPDIPKKDGPDASAQLVQPTGVLCLPNKRTRPPDFLPPGRITATGPPPARSEEPPNPPWHSVSHDKKKARAPPTRGSVRAILIGTCCPDRPESEVLFVKCGVSRLEVAHQLVLLLHSLCCSRFTLCVENKGFVHDSEVTGTYHISYFQEESTVAVKI